MLSTRMPKEINSLVKDMNSAREIALISRLDRAKQNIFKLQSGMTSLRATDPIHKKYEEKLLEESETALMIVDKLKELRRKVKNERYS